MKMVINFFLYLVLSVTVVVAQVSLLSGTVSTSLQLFSGYSLVYAGAGVPFVNLPNERSASSVAGWNWRFGVPSITVTHNNSIDLNDDLWYYNDGMGNMSEIVRVFESGTAKFYLRNSPYSKVTPHYNSPTGQLPVIDGWEIISPDGTIARFGDRGIASTPDTSANRRLPSFNNTICEGVASATPRWFYYQWDIKETETVTHNVTVYSYAQTIRTTNTGYTYTGLSHVTKITSPLNEKIWFFYELKTEPEGPYLIAGIEFDLNDNMFLDEVRYSTADLSCNVNLIYSGESGEVAHLNTGKQGLAKRLLTKIRSTQDKSLNYDLTYAATTGLLQSVTSIKQGKTTTYTYTDKTLNVNLEEQIPLTFPSVNFSKSTVVPMGNHLFAFDYNISGSETLGVKVEIFDKTKGNWMKGEASDVTTGNYLTDTRCYPGPNRFLIVTKNSTTPVTHTVKVYESIDEKWVCTFQKTDYPLINPIEVQQASGYFILFERTRSIFYVYNKINGVWTSTFNAPVDNQSNPTNRTIANEYNSDATGHGWHWKNPSGAAETRRVWAGENYFIYSSGQTFSQTGSTEYHVTYNFYWTGTQWALAPVTGLTFFTSRSISRSSTINGYVYEYSDVPGENNTGNDLRLYADRYFYTNYNGTKFCIRSLKAGAQNFAPELFSLSSGNYIVAFDQETKSMNLAVASLLQPAGDYCVIVEPATPKYKLQVFRWFKETNAWGETFIAPTNGKDPRSGSYAKLFETTVDRIQTSGEYFIAYGDAFLWVLRWDESIGQWISKNNGHTRDGGYNGSLPADDCDQGQEFWFVADNFQCNQDQFSHWTNLSTEWCWKYNYQTADFGFMQSLATPNSTVCKNYLFNDEWIAHTYQSVSSISLQGIAIRKRYQDAWTGNPVVKTVSAITQSDGANTLTNNYGYAGGKQGVDIYNGTGLFGLVNQWQGNGTQTGITQNSFYFDSTSNLYGMPYKTVLLKCAVPNTIKIQARLLDENGTPRSGSLLIKVADGSGAFSVTSTAANLQTDGSFTASITNATNYGNKYKLVYCVGAGGTGTQTDIFTVDPKKYQIAKAGFPFDIDFDGDPFSWSGLVLKLKISTDENVCLWNGKRNDYVGYSKTGYTVNELTRGDAVGIYNNANYKTAFSMPWVSQVVTMRDGVVSRQILRMGDHGSVNGTPTLSYTINGNGDAVVSHTMFACEDTKYPAMKTANMLTQTCGQETMIARNYTGTRVSYEQESFLFVPMTYSIDVTYEKMRLFGGLISYPVQLNVTTTKAIDCLPECNNGCYSTIQVLDFISVSFNAQQINGTGSHCTFQLKINGSYIAQEYKATIYKTHRPIELRTQVLGSGGTPFPVNKVELIVTSLESGLYLTDFVTTAYPKAEQDYLNAMATTWTNTNNLGVWLPEKTYKWNVPQDQTGTPTVDFANTASQFRYNDINYNLLHNWQCFGSAARYDQFGKVVETVNPNGISNTTIIGTKYSLPIGSIANASFYETGVYTCDYDQNQNNYLDYSNGWEKYTSGIISQTVLVPHFGEQTLRIVNGAGTCRNFKVRSNITYEFSAWVKVGASQTATLNAELRTGAATVPQWPMAAGDISFVSLFPAVVQGPTTGWKLIKMTMTIPAGDQYYVRAYISGTDACADDIRFAPKNAMVTSTYYDAKWRQPILSVDANNNPSQQITYDTWGRPIEWRKIDKSNPAVTQLVSKKEYHLMGE